MKPNQIILLLLLSLLTFSCSDTLNDMGIGLRPASDAITVQTDTFHVSTENVAIESISSIPDSFLLGKFYDAKYGSIQADILAQVQGPTDIGFTYPAGAKADSASVMLYYKSWFGDKYAPLDVNIYEMNKKTFSYTGTYLSNLDPAVYTDCSDANRLARKTVTAKDALYTSKLDSTYIKFKLSLDFVQRFFEGGKDKFTNNSTFADFFKGLYITTNYGSSSMLNVRRLDLNLYYHYTYASKTASGKDTTITVKQTQAFPANKLVRQVNCLSHPDKAKVLSDVNKRDSVNYISSPANIQTRVILPLSKMNIKTNAKTTGKKRTINSATLNVEVTEVDAIALYSATVRYLLLVKESEMNFTKKELPLQDNVAVGSLTGVLNADKTAYDSYYYSFDIAKLVASELLKGAPEANMKMMLVPVHALYAATDTQKTTPIAFVKEAGMTAVTIRSGKHKTSPMRINMVYSGF